MPKVHDAFADIWGTEKLWVYHRQGKLEFSHSARVLNTKALFIGIMILKQNLRMCKVFWHLADQTDENMGGFQCIPELFRTYDTWKLTQPDDRDHFKPDITGFEMVKVKMEAGDLLIFNSSSHMASVRTTVVIKFALLNTFP